MALRNQPYLPLYVQDFITDEKLLNCSAAAHGVYIRLMCYMHKSEEYGVLHLKDKFKTSKQTQNNVKANSKQVPDFATMLRRFLPFCEDEIEDALNELIEYGVLQLDGDRLVQKRMVRDAEISEKRKQAGSKGGKVGRGSNTKRYYNEPGFLYLVYDREDDEAFKIGISKTPEKRISGIKRATGRGGLEFRRKWQVEDMGMIEDEVLKHFDDIRDGEWIYGEFNVDEIEKSIDAIVKANSKQTQSKLKANSEYEYEYEYINNKNKDIEILIPFEVEGLAIKVYSEFINFFPSKKLAWGQRDPRFPIFKENIFKMDFSFDDWVAVFEEWSSSVNPVSGERIDQEQYFDSVWATRPENVSKLKSGNFKKKKEQRIAELINGGGHG